MTEFRQCRACGKKLAFAVGPNGKTIPLDMVAPVYRLDGDVAVRAEGHYVTHFATCTKPNDFSRSKEAKS